MIRVDCVILQPHFQVFFQCKVIVRIYRYSCYFKDFRLFVVGGYWLAFTFSFEFSAIWFGKVK